MAMWPAAKSGVQSPIGGTCHQQGMSNSCINPYAFLMLLTLLSPLLALLLLPDPDQDLKEPHSLDLDLAAS